MRSAVEPESMPLVAAEVVVTASEPTPEMLRRVAAHAGPATPAAASVTAPPTICVLLPVYNEQDQLPRTFAAVLEFVRRHPAYSFVFVNDGSRDATAAVLREQLAQAGEPRLSLLDFHRNRGKSRALRHAILRRPEPCLCFLDGDLAYDLDHLPPLLAALETHDLAIGSRALAPLQPHVRGLRRLLGWSFNKLTRVILSLPYRDTQAGLKAFRRPAAQKLFRRQLVRDFSFDAEVLFLAKRYRYTVAQIPATVSPHHFSKPSKLRLLRDSLHMLGALFSIRLHQLRGRYD